MRVLYVDAFSSPWAIATCQGIKKAWEKVSELETFDYRQGVPPNAGEARRKARVRMNERLVRRALDSEPDLIHLGKCETVSGASIQKIKEKTGAKVVHFYGDWRARVQPWVVAIGCHADVTMFQHKDKKLVSEYLRRGCNRIEWWWAGIDPDIFYPRSITKEYPLIFMANLTKSQHAAVRAGQGTRKEFIEHLANAGLEIHLFGNRTHTIKIPNVHPHPFVELDDFAVVCSKGKIALSYGAGQASMYASSPRFVKTMGSGTMLLTHYIPDLETIFENEKHLVWFTSFNEAVRLARYFLIHEDEREQIAEAGRLETLENHTWDSRVQLIRDYVCL